MNKSEILQKFVDQFKDQLNKLSKWLKENPYPQQYMPSKTTVLYKKRAYNYQAMQMNNQIQNCKQIYIHL